MLEGTPIKPIRDDGGIYEEFEKLDPAVNARTFACEARMDGEISEQAPQTSELHVTATAFVGDASLMLVAGQR